MVATAPTQVMQGIVVPASSVNPPEFFKRTRRLTFPFVTSRAFSGLGTTDTFSLLQTGIVSGIVIRLVGTIVVTLGGGTAATTGRWPYDLCKRIRVSANGQSNLINCSGWKLRARDMMAVEGMTDHGVAQSISNVTVNTGTLSLASESWGVGQLQTGIAGAPTTYNYDLQFYVPIAWDRKNLVGSIFAQTASTDLTLAIDWANSTDIFALTGAATAPVTCNITAEAIAFSIPEVNGQIVVPDLSVFHGLIENRVVPGGTGDFENKLVGQGVGRQLMRLYWQLWNGAAATAAPLALTDANYGQALWRFGGNDTPEVYPGARSNREQMERIFGSDLGGPQGFGVFDFAAESAFRDSVDEGAATELRFLFNIASGVTLTNPSMEYVQETLFSGATGA
jgi:hypothetical protein